VFYGCKSLTWCLFYPSSAADTDLQEAPRTSAKVSAEPFDTARCNSPKISYGGKKISNFFWRKRVRKPPNTKAV